MMADTSLHLSPAERIYLARLTVVLQPQCQPGEAIAVLKAAKAEGLDYRKIHKLASMAEPIQSLEEMGLN